MRIPFIDLSIPDKSFREELLASVDGVLKSGQFILGTEVEELEKSIAAYCSSKYAIGVANGTDALMLSLKACGIGSGDEVITAPNSFLASASSIAMIGARPVFVDVMDDLNIDPARIEAVITARTKAIIAVHLTGRPAAMDEIEAIARRRDLVVIEDGAQAFGARYRGRAVGSFGRTGCFSLHPLKNLAVFGDGGIITTDDSDVWRWLLTARNHGLRNRDECEFWSLNSRLDSIHAAMLRISLKHFDRWTARRRQIAHYYLRELQGVVKVPVEKEHELCVFHTFIVQCDRRDELKQYLAENSIDTRIHYPIPIHLQKAASYLGYKTGDFPMAESLARRIISLPVFPALGDAEVEEVAQQIKKFYGNRG